MWDFKHLIIGVIFAVCAIVCGYAYIFNNGGAFGSFAPVGLVSFAFFSFIFLRNVKR